MNPELDEIDNLEEAERLIKGLLELHYDIFHIICEKDCQKIAKKVDLSILKQASLFISANEAIRLEKRDKG